jgi:hypothetical protein
MAIVILVAVLGPSIGEGAVSAFPPDWRTGEAGPVPSVLLDPYEGGEVDAGASTEIGRHLAWDPINWRINSDTTAEVQNEEQVVANPLDPDNLVAVWRDFRLGYRQVGVGYTFDGGVTWTDFLMDEPHYSRQSDPGITVDRFGNFYVVVLSYTGSTSEPNGLFIQKSTDGGETWGGSVEVIDGVPGVFEDKELIACDRTGGAHDGNLYVAWTRFGGITEIKSARSTDGGLGFQSPVQVSDDDGVQWPVPVVGSDGTYYVAWVSYWPSEIRIDRSFDGGATFGSDLTVAEVWTAQTEINGGISVFAFPAMDADITGGTYDGRLYIAYMDRNGPDFDVFLTYSDDHGATWSSPLRINDDAVGNGCDQFHPWLCVSEDGAVNVIFYDRRNDPGNFLMDLYVAQSFDGGASFEPNRRVTTVSSNPTAGTGRAGLIGEYIGLAAPYSARLHPVWTDTREGHQDVYTSIIDTTFAGVPDGTPVAGLSLAGPAPNPFTGSTLASFRAAPGATVEVTVVDVGGRVVRRLRAVAREDGQGALAWDGTDQEGRAVGSGVYFLRASDGSQTTVAKSVLLR